MWDKRQPAKTQPVKTHSSPQPALRVYNESKLGEGRGIPQTTSLVDDCKALVMLCPEEHPYNAACTKTTGRDVDRYTEIPWARAKIQLIVWSNISWTLIFVNAFKLNRSVPKKSCLSYDDRNKTIELN